MSDEEKAHREWAADWLTKRGMAMLAASEETRKTDEDLAIGQLNTSIALQVAAAQIRSGRQP